MNSKLLSIIIPAYNTTRTLGWCLDSIRESSFPMDELEVLVVDNNSTDDLRAFLKKYPEVKYFNEEEQGRSFARNRGLRESSAPLVAFLDADVYVEANWFEVMTTRIARSDMGGGGSRVVPTNELGLESLNKFRIKSIKEDTEGKFSLMQIIAYESPMLNSAACMYKREALLKVGGFDTSLERHEDIDLSKRVALSGYNLFTTWNTSAYVHYHGESWRNYFMRAFRDGLTKIDYLRKWEKLETEPKVLAHSQESSNDETRKFLLLEIISAQIWLTKKFLKDPGVFWLLKFLVMGTQLLGRIIGKLFLKDERKPFKVNRSLEHLPKEKRDSLVLDSLQYLFFDNFVYSFDTSDLSIKKYGPVEFLYLERFFHSDGDLSYEELGVLTEKQVLGQLGP